MPQTSQKKRIKPARKRNKQQTHRRVTLFTRQPLPGKGPTTQRPISIELHHLLFTKSTCQPKTLKWKRMPRTLPYIHHLHLHLVELLHQSILLPRTAPAPLNLNMHHPYPNLPPLPHLGGKHPLHWQWGRVKAVQTLSQNNPQSLQSRLSFLGQIAPRLIIWRVRLTVHNP